MTALSLAVAYCGPIAQPGTPARGGFESANRRLIDDLRTAGIIVGEYPYASERRSRLGRMIAYGVGFLALAWRLWWQADHYQIFHITPLRDQFSLPEELLCRIARKRGQKIVFDIRAGDFASNLRSDKKHERNALHRCLAMADLICVEGADDLDLLDGVTENTLYLPNYVDSIPDKIAAPLPYIGLVFLGRVVPEKGIEAALESLLSLHDRGYEARLTIIGRGDNGYITSLEQRYRDLPIAWLGAVPYREVPTRLAGQRFFIFPTRHSGEGHSNALTEAMSQGLVPIVADNGFNRSVVADAGVVLPKNADGRDYADAIINIITTESWAQLSEAARQRIAQHYTGSQLVPQLIGKYRALLQLAPGHASYPVF